MIWKLYLIFLFLTSIFIFVLCICKVYIIDTYIYITRYICACVPLLFNWQMFETTDIFIFFMYIVNSIFSKILTNKLSPTTGKAWILMEHGEESRNCNIYCFQDTHFTEIEYPFIVSLWRGECFINSFFSNQSGVVILCNTYFEYKFWI